MEIAEQADYPNEGVSIQIVKQQLEKAGHRRIAATLALTMLNRKDFVETVVGTNYNGDEFPVAKVTPEGWKLSKANQSILVLNVVTQSPTESGGDDPIPF